jgi:hypothetical protein
MGFDVVVVVADAADFPYFAALPFDASSVVYYCYCCCS